MQHCIVHVIEVQEGELPPGPAVLEGGTAHRATGEIDVARGLGHEIVIEAGHGIEIGRGVTPTRRRERNRLNLRMSELAEFIYYDDNRKR